MRFRLSEAARVVGRIRRRDSARTVARFVARGKRGTNRFKLPSRRLKPGRYQLVLVATDRAGNRSRPARTTVSVRRS